MALKHIRPGETVRLAPWRALVPGERTSALLKGSELEVVQIVLGAGHGLPEHSAPGEITVLCLAGTVDFDHAGETSRLEPGDFMHLAAQAPHGLRAVTDAVLLVTISLQRRATPGS